MNSDVHSSIGASDVCVRTPRPILILTAIYVAMLVAVGIVMLMKWGGVFWFVSLPVALMPALIYATASFVWGPALFGNVGPAQSARAWLKLLWMIMFLYATLCAIAVVLDILPEEPGITHIRPWTYHFVVAIATVLLALWAYIGGTVFVRNGPSLSHANPLLSIKLGLALVTSASMMLVSLAFNVGYDRSGWSVITWQGGWVTAEFIQNAVLWPFLNLLLWAGYVAGLVLAFFAVITGVWSVVKKPISLKSISILLNASVVVFWFTLTNYYSDCVYFVFINYFIPHDQEMEAAIITAAWLLMFALGVWLWFKYRHREDNMGRDMRTGLMLWYLPLMPAAITTFWIAADFELYGLILYVAGLQIATACWWKMFNARAIP